MKFLSYNDTQRVILDPGEYYASKHPEVISTLLGSCVAACLYDPDSGVFGMNHFLLAYQHHASDQSILHSEDGRYGVYAMELLINRMMHLGANRLNLLAKCFGGANVLKLREDSNNRATVGEVNVMFIKEFLKIEKIRMVASCLGGVQGRNLHFVGKDFSVFVQKIGEQEGLALEQQERRYWKKSIDASKKTKTDADFW